MPAAILLEARSAIAGSVTAVGGTPPPGRKAPSGRGGEMVGGGAVLKSASNSGNAERLFQSGAPSSWARVWALTRLWAIQVRICSAVAGPYCWSLLPIIRYIGFPLGSGRPPSVDQTGSARKYRSIDVQTL